MTRLLRIGTRRTWPEVRPAIERGLEAAFPGVDVAVDDEPSIAWHDGPGEATLAAAVGDVPGWRLCVALEQPDAAADGGNADRRKPIRLRRSFSDEALAVAVVRFQASTVRPFDSARPGAEATLRDILDVDDPAVSGYPLTDAMAALLLTAPDPGPDDESGGSRADHWSRKLTTLGYNALWNQAYATAPL